MKLKNILIVVKEIERSRQFYHDLFGLKTILDGEGNVILTEGLVLQEAKTWEQALQKEVIWKNHSSELYFEESNLDDFVKKLEEYPEKIEYVSSLTEDFSGQKVIRLYDPDGNLIEIRTPR